MNTVEHLTIIGPGNGNQGMNHPHKPSLFHPGAEKAGKESGACLLDPFFQGIHIHEGHVSFIIVGINGAESVISDAASGMRDFFMLRPVSVADSHGLQGILIPVQQGNIVIYGIHIMEYMVYPLLFLVSHASGNIGYPDLDAGPAVAPGNRAAHSLQELISHQINKLMHHAVGYAFIQIFPKNGRKLQGRIIHMMLRFHKILVPHMMDHINIGTVGKKVSDPVAVIFQKGQGLIGLEIDHADGIIVGLPGPCLHLQPLPHAVVKAFLIGHGLSEEKALHLFTAPVLQKFKLLPCFHPFRQTAGTDALIHGNDGADNLSGPFTGASQKGHIDFQHIKEIALQQVQRGVAASEIIHPDFIACLPEPVKALPDAGIHGVKQPFRDFDMNHVPGHIVLQHPVLYFLENITLQEVQAGQIHRYRHHRTALGHAAGKIFAYLPDDFQIQLMNLPALFQGGNEIHRLEESPLRILPPGQGLHAAESAGHGAHNGLVIGLDVSLFHRFIHMTGYIILQLHLPVQSRRVVSHEMVAAVMDAVAGNLDPGHRQIGVCPPAAQLVNACLAVHLGRRAKS